MPSTLGYMAIVTHDAVHKTVVGINSAAPKTIQIVFERLRLPYSVISISFDIFDKLIYPLKRLFILSLPVQIVSPGRVVPNQHCQSSIKLWAAQFFPLFRSATT